MTNQRDIARLAKTSLKTVSRVINRDPLVNEVTRKRIQDIIDQTGYVPNEAARMMRSQTSDIVGFLSEDVATTSSSIDLVRGAQDVAHAMGKQMMLFNIRRGEASETEALAQLARFRAGACILATSFHREVPLPRTDMKTVLLNCYDAAGETATVLPDDRQLGHDLVQELLRRGYRRPLFLNLAPELAGARLRAEGFVAAGREAGMDLSGHPSRAPDRDLPDQGPQPDHAPRGPVHSHAGGPADDHRVGPGGRQLQCGLRLRWRIAADRSGCGARDDEAGRQPVDDAQLRGLPVLQVTGQHPLRRGSTWVRATTARFA